MSTLVCPRCNRSNPGVAIYCHFDGVVLNQNFSNSGSVPGFLPKPFVFPSTRQCQTLEQLAHGLVDEWEVAGQLLKQGKIRLYFSSIGRTDLARAAQEAEQHVDVDIGLHHFLRNFSLDNNQKPRVDLKPRRLNLDQIRPGEVREIPIQIFNIGQGQLQGKIKVAEGGEWLQIQGASNAAALNGQYRLQKQSEQQVVLRIDTRGLAAPKSYTARLHVISNGGIAEVPVRLDLGATPFPHAPFKGARTPREMAEKMAKNPKKAVPLLDQGVVQEWFTANGWDYPVQGAQAQGVAAVQQFFEAMGLSKPPMCKLSQSEVQCLCIPPEVGTYDVQIRTPSKKWIYAQVDSDSYWLRVVTPNVSGAQKATIQFEVDSSIMDPGIHEGHLQIVANGGQTLPLRVVVDVQEPHVPFTRRLLRPFFSSALIAICYRFLFMLPGDLYARLLAGKSPPGVEKGSLDFWKSPAIEVNGEFLRSMLFVTWWIGLLVGLLILKRVSSRSRDMVSGAIAGTVAGVAFVVTLASVVTLIDGVPRALLSMFPSQGTAPFMATCIWLMMALFCWALIGGAIGFALSHVGRWGRSILTMIGSPIRRVFQSVGLKRAASSLLIEPQG